MSPPPPSRPRKRDDVVFRRVSGDWLLFDPRTRQIHVLNLSAALVWSFCTGEHETDEIARQVVEAFAGGDTPDVEAEAEATAAPGRGGSPDAADFATPADRSPPDAGPRSVEEILARFRAEGLLEEGEVEP